jgi:tetratricopeptide (TPR) repeat protein
MSLIMDLLSKAKTNEKKTGIPPDLRKTIIDSTFKRKTRKRIIFLSAIVLFAFVVGFGVVYYMESYTKPMIHVMAQKTPPVVQRETVAPSQVAERTKIETKLEVKPEPEKVQISQPISKRQEETVLPKTKTLKKDVASISDKKETQFRRESDTMKAFAKDTTKSSSVDRENKDIYLYTARTYESRNEYNPALSNYKKALELDPRNYIIMNNISGVLIRLGLYEEAMWYAKSALNVKANYVPSLINTGIAYLSLKNFTEGEAYLSKALTMEPSNRAALFNLGILYEKQKEYDKAYNYYIKIYGMGDLEGHLGVARILERQGRNLEAARFYREILSIDNADQSIKRFANEKLNQLLQ